MPATAITEAVFARVLSSQKPQRMAAAKVLHPSGRLDASRAEAFTDDVRDALYASKVVAYAQGFEQIAAAAEAYMGGGAGRLATIWRGGCIIRARVPGPHPRGLWPIPAWGTRCSPTTSGTPSARPRMPGGGSWPPPSPWGCPPRPACWPTTTACGARGPANLLQAQRDFFGAHTYRRVDRPGSFHTRWSQDGQEVDA